MCQCHSRVDSTQWRSAMTVKWERTVEKTFSEPKKSGFVGPPERNCSDDTQTVRLVGLLWAVRGPKLTHRRESKTIQSHNHHHNGWWKKRSQTWFQQRHTTTVTATSRAITQHITENGKWFWAHSSVVSLCRCPSSFCLRRRQILVASLHVRAEPH